jgi:hypothetical protein
VVLLSAAYALTIALLSVYAAHRLWLVLELWRHRRAHAAPPPPPDLPDPLPRVTVQLPLYNERHVAERLIDAVGRLDWPADRLEIQVLDDSTDDTVTRCAAAVAALRSRGLDASHLRRPDRDGYKAGALAAGLATARGELICVLDADFLPPPDLLRATVGHFSDPRVGMVQARWEHLNRYASLLTRVQALLLDGHFAVEQAVRARGGRFFNFNGTAGVWRRAAIDAAGGWHCDTLTEDLDLSYRALLAGWRFVYLLHAAAPAELPVDMNAFKAQQFRWAKGSVQVARKLLPAVLRAPLPARVKLDALAHLTQNVPYALTLLLALLVVPALVIAPAGGAHPRWLDAALLAGTIGTLAAYCAASQWAVRRARPLAAIAAVPALVAITAGICVSQTRAIVEALLGRRSEFVRTPKHGLTGRERRPRGSYRAARSAVIVAELALAACFAAALVYGLDAGRWWAAPICAAFALGFGYVGLSSALPALPAPKRKRATGTSSRSPVIRFPRFGRW